MTCIAFDGRYLAADSGTFTGELMTTGAEKIRIRHLQKEYAAFALCGTNLHLLALEQYLRYGDEFDLEKLGTDYGPSCTCGLIVKMHSDGKPYAQFIYANGTIDPQKFELIANGAGSAFLMGALTAGASAMEAVNLSKIHTTAAGGDVRCIDCLELEPSGNPKVRTYVPED